MQGAGAEDEDQVHAEHGPDMGSFFFSEGTLIDENAPQAAFGQAGSLTWAPHGVRWLVRRRLPLSAAAAASRGTMPPLELPVTAAAGTPDGPLGGPRACLARAIIRFVGDIGDLACRQGPGYFFLEHAAQGADSFF